MKKAIYLLFMGIFAAGFVGCKSGESISQNPADLQGDWNATAMNGQQMQGQNKYTVSFNTDGTVAGVADCNRFAGKYSAQEKGMVSMDDVSATKLKCDSNSQKYLDAIMAANTFKVMSGGDKLQLMSSSNSNSMVFTKVMMEDEGK